MIKYLLILFIFFLYSCKDLSNSYFPLDDKKKWSYEVIITPEIDKPIVYKKINYSIGKTKIKDETYFPFLRENGSIYYYKKKRGGVFRNGISFEKDNKINFHKKERLVLPNPIKVGDKWEVDSKTYLILKRYPYYDYRATTNFKINYEVLSKKEFIRTPLGKFSNCIYLKGTGKTKFIGDSEIGAIEINISSEEWYAKGIGLIKSKRIEETNSDLFGKTIMVQTLESFE
jgi:hypothetical protein